MNRLSPPPLSLQTQRQAVDWAIASRRRVGSDLYNRLGISKLDKERMHLKHGHNYRFFNASVGLLLAVDKVLQEGSLLEYEIFLQSVSTAFSHVTDLISKAVKINSSGVP